MIYQCYIISNRLIQQLLIRPTHHSGGALHSSYRRLMYTKAFTQPFITASYKSIILHQNSSEIFSVRPGSYQQMFFCEYKSQDVFSQVKVAQIYIFIDKTPPLAEGFKSFYQPDTQCCTLQGTHKNITMNCVLAVKTQCLLPVVSLCIILLYVLTNNLWEQLQLR